MDLPEVVKRLSAVVTVGSVLLYGAGYLSLRARSRALGTEPAFDLVDQIYVFNGFRLGFAVVFALAVVVPVALVGVQLWRLLPSSRSERLRGSFEWLGVAGLYGIALLSLLALAPAGVLLESAAQAACSGALGETAGKLVAEVRSAERAVAVSSALEAAVLRPSHGVTVAFVSLVASLAAAGIWLFVGRQTLQTSKRIALASATAILLFVMPVFHGAYLAERHVRVLSEVPAAAPVLREPVAIVDRTASQLSLYGHDSEGCPAIVLVAAADIGGLPARAIEPLHAFLAALRSADAESEGSGGGEVPHGPKPSIAGHDASYAGDLAIGDLSPGFRGFINAVVEELKFTLVNVGNLGGEDEPGEFWAVDLDREGNPINRRRIVDAANFTWPVAGIKGSGFAAIQEGSLVAFQEDGSPIWRFGMRVTWRKLLGIAPDGSVLGLVERDGATVLASVSPGASVFSDPPTSDADTKAVQRLALDARLYRNGLRLYVERSERGARGFDVFLKRAGRVVNVSDCGDDSCTQPSLSPDQSRVLYIRTRSR